ncbi:hypothetical protein ACFWBV_34115 [Streptomyces sp. NPDC060030]|uniref:hypothetical protein n=1 Tax=Streptomyces sp. NPDC060030 TaxID=3347042 RepID=UPI00367BAE48
MNQDAGGKLFNRVRHVNHIGLTVWSRSGPVDPRVNDLTRLTGVFTGLQRPADGPLWVMPRSPIAGITALDSETGRSLDIGKFDADTYDVLIKHGRVAVHVQMVERDGHRRQVLAGTDLATGQTRLEQPCPVPLRNLIGTDDAGNIFARNDNELIRIAPLWRISVRGVVCDRQTGSITVAYGSSDSNHLSIVTYASHGSPSKTYSLSLGKTGSRHATLIDVLPGPQFLLHANGSVRTAGNLLTADCHGEISAAPVTGESVADTLWARESRIDLKNASIAADGGVLIPLSDPYGYRVVHLHPIGDNPLPVEGQRDAL